jgi:hypothetical protein
VGSSLASDRQHHERGVEAREVEGDDVGDLGAPHAAGLAAEPAPAARPGDERGCHRVAVGRRRGVHDPRERRQRRPCAGRRIRDRRRRRSQAEPEEPVRAQRERVRRGTDRREVAAAEQLHRDRAGVRRQVEPDGLREPRQVGHDQQDLVPVAAEEGDDVAVLRVEQLQRPPSERRVALPQGDDPLRPPQERVATRLLGRDVHRLVVVRRIDDDRQEERLARRAREPGVAVGGPLHRRPQAVAVAEMEVVAHPDLVAVVEDRRAGEGEEKGVEELDPAPVVAEERGKAAPDPDVVARQRVGRVGAEQVIALLVRDHLEGQLVVAPQEERPLGARRRRGRLLEDVDDREAILGLERHVHPRHEREVEGQLALVAGAEVGGGVLRPLVRLGDEDPAREALVDVAAELAHELVGLRQVLAGRPLALEQVREAVEAQPVDPEAQPVVDRPQDLAADDPAGVVEVRLVGVEAVPVVGPGHRVPGPVRGLALGEEDPGPGETIGGVAPDVDAVPGAPRRGPSRPFEPGMLVGGVVEDELGDDAEPAPVGLADEAPQVGGRPVVGVDAAEVGDVVAAVAQGRGVERQEPQGGDAEVGQVVELLEEPREVADPVAVPVAERADVELVQDRVAVPVGGVRQAGGVPARAVVGAPTSASVGAPTCTSADAIDVPGRAAGSRGRRHRWSSAARRWVVRGS